MRRNDFKQLANLYKSVYIVNEANFAVNNPKELIKQALEQELKAKGIDLASPISQWFNTKYVNWYTSDQDDNMKNLSPHKYVEGESPGWAKDRNDVSDFTGFSPNEQQRIGHIIDYFVNDRKNDLKEINKEKYEDIVKKVAEQDQIQKNQRDKYEINDSIEGEDFIVLYATRDAKGRPVKWVDVKSAQCKQFEGDAMGHCVGGAQYANKIIHSLYDSKNLPHVTLEFEGKEIRQIKGKGNAAPADAYQPPTYEYIKDLVDNKGYKVTGDGDNIGMAHFESKYYFRDTPEWKDIFTNKIVPMQQRAFDEIKKRIKVIATEGYEYASSYMYNLLKEKRSIW